MASNTQPPANSPPPKPWEQAGSSSGPTPFKPPSPGSTSDVVEASGTAKPGEIVSTTDRNTPANRNALGRPVPARPWEQQTYGSTYGGYGTGTNYNSGYGSGMYGSYGGGLGGSYGGGMYGNSMYRGGYGGGGAGGLYGGSGMYGGGMYNGGLGGPMGGYGMGMGGPPYGNQDPNNPFGDPPSPPGFWVSFLRVYGNACIFSDGRCGNLLWPGCNTDRPEYAGIPHVYYRPSSGTFVFLLDRSGLLYGELARFVLRLLGIRTKPKRVQPPGSDLPAGPHNPHGGQNYIEGPKAAPSGAWDGVWGDNAGK
ncbi:hypothetical protein RHGRI_002644 [Rhododendron griersonianum]|uniref:Peroxin-13 n=1 Tax=Rhododendron griersonianum TaxID=479676 RepID=A0AAV6LPP3_9ERIC|nr:hypothetical protein RHGRI_002644 [Rhododendron griersonianum]